MPNANIPDNLPEDRKSKNPSWINSLLENAVQWELKNNIGVISPVSYDEMTYPDIYQAVRGKMKYLQRTQDSDFDHISETDIIAMTDSAILVAIEKYAQPLKNARRNLFINLRRTFSNIREKIPGFDEQMLLQKIEILDENEINKLYLNNRALSQFVSQYFWVTRELLLFRDRDFKELFATTILQNSSSDLFSRTERAAMAYKNHGITPTLELIQELIGFYGSADKNKKKEICDFFDIKISIPEALKSSLMSESDIESIAQEEFVNIWDKIDDTARKSLVEILKYDDNYNIDLSTFDINQIDRSFSSKKIKDIITRAIHNDLEKNKTSLSPKNGITRDLVPEIWEDGIPRIHNPFLDLVKSKIVNKNWISKIKNIENLIVWSTFIFTDEADRIRYFQINETDTSIGEYEQGVSISDITGKEPNSIWEVKDTNNVTYDDFYHFLLSIDQWRVLTHEELQIIKTQDKNDNIGQDPINEDGNILDVSNTESIVTLEGFMREIDLLDPDGKAIWIEKWVSFASKWVLENGEEYDWVWSIKDISPPNISIYNQKHVEVTTLDAFLEVAKSQTFRRIAKLDTSDDLLHVLHSFWVDHDAHIQWDHIVIADHAHWDHDSHHSKNKEKKYEFFQSKSWWHIKINGFANGLVSFWEYVSSASLVDVQKKGNANKLSTKEKDWLYDDRTVSYGEFIDYLKKNDMKATTDNILVPNATDAYHPHDPHFENDFGSFMSKVGSWWSIADIMKWFSNLTHGIEHYFEKSSKLNASRFALTMWRKMGLPLDIMAQLQADEVSWVKEIIEKIQEKFKNLNGPVWRKKALHIAHNKNARPEEVGAAILHLIKWYWSLYAEDIAYAQWSESFINGLLTSCWFTWTALLDMKKKAREKSKILLGNEAGSDVSEEEMIWWFMKMMDGKSEEYPIAATLVKAMGGPSGFENAWRKDGFNGAYEKWVRQAGDLVNAEARVDHGLSALATHEYHTAIGSMEKAAEKDPSPGIQTLPVVWALGWYSKYLSTKANQKIKSYADGKWHSLHAFAFLRTRNDNDLYRHTFREALKQIAPWDVAKLDTWIKDLEYDGHTEKWTWDRVKAAINGLASIWRKYHNKWLHDMLQWKNMWLMENAQKDPIIKKYFEHFGAVHQNNSGDQPHSDDGGWYIQHGYSGSPIMNSVNNEFTWWYTLNSFDRILRKIKIDSHQLRIDKDHKERYWDPMVKIITNLGRGSQDEKVKKAQFLQYRRDILLRMNEAFSSRWEKKEDLKKQEFYKDLLRMGIDISIIFESWTDIHKKINNSSERDYLAWKEWWYAWGGAVSSEIQSVSNTVKSTISSRQDAWYQWRWRNQNWNPDFDFNTSDHFYWPIWQNPLSDGSWPD